MYMDFFKLKESPFNLVSDPRFLYYSESHCEAMAHLLYGVRERKGIILLLGEAGTGKTTLVRATLEMLRSTRVVSSVIMNPILSSPEEFLETVLRGFGLEGFRRSCMEMMDVLQRFLMKQSTLGRLPVLIIDEAQELPRPLLEHVRLLSNLEGRGHKLLQFVLAAQPEMSKQIESYELRALRQRIVVRCRLGALNAEETWSYIHSRLLCAGGGEKEIFTPSAVEMIYAYSGGIPRLINIIADNCLLASYARNLCPVEPAVVASVVRHLELEEIADASAVGDKVHQDVLRASSSWKEVVHDIRTGSVPPALRQFIEKLQTPDEVAKPSFLSVAAQGE